MKKFIIGLGLALVASAVLIPASRAQSAASPGGSRVLFIFDTSSAMKKRLPAEVKSIKRLFALAFAEQLHRGDTIGVWTFDQDLRTGEFPLQNYQPEALPDIASNIILFVESRHYSKTTSFEKMVPTLNRVINSSGRLTTLIFCDGETPISGTVYDDSINRIFKEHGRDMRKMREPFVIVFKSQDGQYISSTINAAEEVNVPPFPPPPAPPPPIVTPAPPPPSAQPLIIIDHPNPAPPPPARTPPPAQSPVTNAPAPAAPAHPAVAPPPQSLNSTPPAKSPVAAHPAPEAGLTAAPSNVVASLPPAAPNPPAIVPTPSALPTPETTGVARDNLLAAGAGILLVAGVFSFLLLRRTRRHGSESLITQSLKKR